MNIEMIMSDFCLMASSDEMSLFLPLLFRGDL